MDITPEDAMDAQIARHTEAVRRFSRFYTRQLGLLQEGLLRSPFSLTEGRVVYELAQRDEATPGELCQLLGVDAGYMSRILKSFAERGLVARTASPRDGRQSLYRLTEAGRAAYDAIDAASRGQIEGLLSTLSSDEQVQLVGSMETIERVLDPPAAPRVPYLLRSHQPGDIGWVVYRHGVLYSREYGWNEEFEALVADIAARFIRELDPARERCWIAEREGENVGSVFLVRHPERDGVAKLRLLLVEPSARGLGIGRRLVAECTRFARQAGYHTITLWTNSVLHAARSLYEAEGYRLVAEEAHHSFGKDLVGQTWELTL
jgi:DNA-binding MarR family transcriptional regulator/GNAT superfamily N-acetyltransferase